jgi:stage V sporulation protein AC
MAVNEETLKTKFMRLSKISAPKPNLIKRCFFAFTVGGTICVIGQFFNDFFIRLGFPKDEAGTYVVIGMIFLGALLTGLGVYDKIASVAGAGTVVPITGFANAVVSPAMEFKREGFIFGVAAKMFTIAGPVLVYGIGFSVLVGLIHYINISLR